MKYFVFRVIVVLFCAVSCTSVTPSTPAGLLSTPIEVSDADAQPFATPSPPQLQATPTEASHADTSPSVTPASIVVTASNEIKELYDYKSSVRDDSLFETLIKPLANEAQKRREDRAKKEPEYAKRVDKELNEGRINFLLYGYGE